ncbi:SURF1 family protein [Marinobacter profundi]|uniref:SURF1-like protein n=1 Tax=Marinobacter profundi TaxID=2666256 RepID=A0A2G1UL52_9GAMM|nr:SURF1 family protein [Marinobacter profundi]PHQ15217.1 hypothetical protein CLH61_08740 [Marinobacter profundi]
MTDHQWQPHRQWHFDWRLLVFAGLFLPLLVGLGIWQLGRAEQKQQRLDQWQQQAEQLDWAGHLHQGLAVGRPVSLQGRYGEAIWLLDNRTRDGVAGYEVLNLFHPRAGQPVVVNRGWIRAPQRREVLPVVPTPVTEVTIHGRISDYPQPPVLQDTDEPGQGWPRRVQTLGRDQVRQVAAEAADLVVRLSNREQPGAFRADWAPDRMGPQTHYGYALQWFALAGALLALTVIASYRKTGADNDNDNG